MFIKKGKGIRRQQETRGLPYNVSVIVCKEHDGNVTVRGQDLIFSIIHLSSLAPNSPFMFTISTMFFTDVYQYMVW